MRSHLLPVLLLVLGQQVPPLTPAIGPAPPVNDPVTMRGCLEGRFLRILEHDSSDLSGIRDIRLKGPRGVMRTMEDHQHRYVEVTGKLNLGRPDRIEARRKVKAGSKGTISIVASSEQTGPLAHRERAHRGSGARGASVHATRRAVSVPLKTAVCAQVNRRRRRRLLDSGPCR